MKRSYGGVDDSSRDNKIKYARTEPTLKTRPVAVFKGDGKFPYFRQPTEIGSLSLDIKRNFHNDRSMLKHYVPPNDIHKVRFDLTKGYHNFIEKDETFKEYINDILKWINCNRDKFLLEEEKKKSVEEKNQIRLVLVVCQYL